MQIEGTNLDRIAIVDDDKAVRDGYEDVVSELRLTPVAEEGPLPSFQEYLDILHTRADAAICDHHLKVKMYAQFNGAELVAGWYEREFPAILCTRFDRTDINDLRPRRKYIPILLNPQEMNPDTLLSGIEQIVREFKGEFKSIRKPWRTLIRIEEVGADSNAGIIYVVVPAWDSKKVISLRLSDLPSHVQDIVAPGRRLHAQVNTGAESDIDLYFDSWETE